MTDHDPLAAIEELATTMEQMDDGAIVRFKSGIEVPLADIPHGFRAALAEAREAVDALVAERDAYRKAKQENDERFMLERDEARVERDRLREALGRVEELSSQPNDQVECPYDDVREEAMWRVGHVAAMHSILTALAEPATDEEAGQ